MMQYLFQSFNFRGDGKPYLDLIQGIAIEEISHVELISKTISQLLDGAPDYHGKRFDVPPEFYCPLGCCRLVRAFCRGRIPRRGGH